MADAPDRTTGIKLLIQNLKKEFRIPENLEHYSKEDFQEAEKKFLRFCLQNGCNLDDRDLARDNNNDDLDLTNLSNKCPWRGGEHPCRGCKD